MYNVQCDCFYKLDLLLMPCRSYCGESPGAYQADELMTPWTGGTSYIGAVHKVSELSLEMYINCYYMIYNYSCNADHRWRVPWISARSHVYYSAVVHPFPWEWVREYYSAWLREYLPADYLHPTIWRVRAHLTAGLRRSGESIIREQFVVARTVSEEMPSSSKLGSLTYCRHTALIAAKKTSEWLSNPSTQFTCRPSTLFSGFPPHGALPQA